MPNLKSMVEMVWPTSNKPNVENRRLYLGINKRGFNEFKVFNKALIRDCIATIELKQAS